MESANMQPQMSGEELIAEANLLAVPVTHLRTTANGSSPRLAVWSADILSKKARPWIAVDLRHHPDHSVRRDGVLHVIVDQFEEDEGTAEFKSGDLPKANKKEIDLYGFEATELPPLDLLFENGSPKIQKWLDRLEEEGWKHRDYPDGSDFPVPVTRNAYAKHWQSQHPVFDSTVATQLGGYPLTWPEEKASVQLEKKFILPTYRGSEPWVEVFQCGDEYEVVLRYS